MTIKFSYPTLAGGLSEEQLSTGYAYLCDTIVELPHVRIASERADLADLQPVADRFRSSFEDVVILGTGGSNLGAKSICALSSAISPRLHFMDNVDPHTFEVLFSRLDPHKTGFIVISKSGNTAETLAQFLLCSERWKNEVGEDNLKTHFLTITEPRENTLRQLSDKYDLPCLDHPTDIGGRFSCLTVVGLLPAMIAGLNAEKVREGAQAYLAQCFLAKDCAPLLGALHATMDDAYPINVLMPYADRLTEFGMWYRQLWAESLGKDGKGLTPIRAMGTVDQHSQLQLYLDGPKDKYFTVLTYETQGHGDTLSNTGVDYLDNHTLGDLLAAEAKATIDTLEDNGCPVRTIHLDALHEASMGALFMHYMLETLVTAHFMGIDAFSQPAVEQGKILTKEYLAA